jgi:hypothetical protein
LKRLCFGDVLFHFKIVKDRTAGAEHSMHNQSWETLPLLALEVDATAPAHRDGFRGCLARGAPMLAGASKARSVIILASSTLTGPSVCTILSGQLPMSCGADEATSAIL